MGRQAAAQAPKTAAGVDTGGGRLRPARATRRSTRTSAQQHSRPRASRRSRKLGASARWQGLCAASGTAASTASPVDDEDGAPRARAAAARACCRADEMDDEQDPLPAVAIPHDRRDRRDERARHHPREQDEADCACSVCLERNDAQGDERGPLGRDRPQALLDGDQGCPRAPAPRTERAPIAVRFRIAPSISGEASRASSQRAHSRRRGGRRGRRCAETDPCATPRPRRSPPACHGDHPPPASPSARGRR